MVFIILNQLGSSLLDISNVYLSKLCLTYVHILPLDVRFEFIRVNFSLIPIYDLSTHDIKWLG